MRVPISSVFMVVAMETSVGLLWGRPEFRVRFVAIETPKGHRPTRQQTVQQPEVSPEVTMGEVSTQVSILTDGTTRTSHLTYPLHMGPWKRPPYFFIFAAKQHPAELRNI